MRFPEFTGEWKLHATTDYFEFKNGLNPEAKRFGLGTKFISVMDILNNRYITYDKVIASVLPKDDDLKEFGVNYGDILFQRSSETLEDIGRANVYLDDKTALFGGFVIRGKKIGNYNPLFFRYLLSSPNARKSIIVKGAGAQHFNISQDGLSKVLLNVPSIQEQEKISQFINYIDERIDTQSKIIEQLQSLIKGICNKVLYSETGKSVKIGDILIERKERTTINNQYEILSSTIKGVFSQREYFSKDIASENNIGYKIIRLNDIVISPQNLWMGNINFNDKFDIGIVSPSYKIFTINSSFDKTFIASLLKSHRALYNYIQVSEQGASIVRRNLNLEAFEHLVFKIPSLNEQCKVSNIIKSVLKKIECENQLIKKYEEQKKFLLSNMFI